MDIKITIETWNDNWRFEIEDKSESEIVKTGYGETFTECAAKCLEFVAENAAQQIDTLDGLWDCANCNNRQIGGGFTDCPNCGTARQ